ncbi:MAG: chromosomal replication initiator protein DnaA [Oscillospiraceae bacterium]|nr:chromosomal replication initiator protein DnaA [Oscillospiraceae bacterium]
MRATPSSPENYEQLFWLVSEYCRGHISDIAHTLWIKEIKPTGFDNSTVYLRVKNKFKKDIITEKYLRLLASGYEEVLGFAVELDISCDEDYPDTADEDYPAEEDEEGGDYEYTFGNFIVGSSNKFAHAASLAVASNPGRAYNPLFIYGASGLGKTHLLTAIGTEIQKNFPEKKQMLVKGDHFTNELINSISNQTTAIFHDKYRTPDVLLVDDIQFIGGKESTQEEFFHTFNALYEDNRQIIMTSDRPPKEIKTLEDRLRTRFEWGLLADIQTPDFETRTAIIRRKAEQIGIVVPTEVAEYIANRLKTNIRQLEGAVKKLAAYRLIHDSPPSIMVAQTTIRDILNDNQPVPITIDRIITEVGRTYGLTPADIRSHKRSASISSARQVSIYVVREITQISMAAIGEEFGGRDHSTMVYAVQQVEKNMARDPRFKEMVEDIVKNIRGS